MNKEQVSAYLDKVFPQITDDFAIDELSEERLIMRLLTADRHLRPGGTISGPSMFALADVSVYALLLARIGPKALAVTTNCSLDFMRKPDGDKILRAHTKLLKLGKSLVVGDILMYSDGCDKAVARSTMTYAIPPEGSAAAAVE